MINIYQKFKRGDVVRIGKMPPHMEHFQGNTYAIVMGSYADICRGHSPEDKTQYQVMFDDGCEVSWYEENQLTFKGHASELEMERLKQLFDTEHA